MSNLNVEQWHLWVGFHIFVFTALAFDLGVFHKKNKELNFKESIKWSLIWISCALSFCFAIFYFRGQDQAFEFLAAYVVEWSLSVDNLFVFLTLFTSFQVPAKYQHKVLFWGIIGAFIMRASFIIVGLALLKKFSWLMYIFGGFLVFAGIKLLTHDKDEDSDFKNHWLIKFLRRKFRFTDEYHDDRFFVKTKEGLLATPLFLVLILVELTDLVFATDSIPAVMAVTKDTFIAYTSNIFAILGLRSMYFAIAHLLSFFKYLNVGLAGVLIFIGVKMCVAEFYHVPTHISLLVILSLLGLAVVFSIIKKDSKGKVVK